jgi:hypothetical protein
MYCIRGKDCITQASSLLGTSWALLSSAIGYFSAVPIPPAPAGRYVVIFCGTSLGNSWTHPSNFEAVKFTKQTDHASAHMLGIWSPNFLRVLLSAAAADMTKLCLTAL